MADLPLVIDNIRAGKGTDNPLKAGVVVGADVDTIWSDSDPATYTETWLSRTGSNYQEFAAGALPTIPPDTVVTGATISISYAMLNQNAATAGHAGLELRSEFGPFMADLDPDQNLWRSAPDTAVRTWSLAGTDLDALVGYLKDTSIQYDVWVGRYSNFGDSTPAHYKMQTFELSITLTVPDVEPPPTETPIRVTRQFPRDDAYGLGSAPRIHPPPRRGRIVGGQD